MKKWVGVAMVVVGITVAVVALAVPAFGRSAGSTVSTGNAYDQGDWDDMAAYCQDMMGSGMMAGGMMGGYMGIGDNVTLGRVAGVLGLTTEQFIAQLNQGKTVAQIAQAQGVDTALVVTTILAPQSEILQVRVKYGYLTAAQAQAILEQAQLRVEQALNTATGAIRNPVTGNTPAYGNRGMMGGGTTGGGMMGGGMMGGGMMGGGMMGGSTTGGGMMGRGFTGW